MAVKGFRDLTADRRRLATEATLGVDPGAIAVEPRRRSLKTFDSLSIRSFRWYFFSMLGWFASMNMQQLARGVIVYDMTGSYAALGMISLANAVPGLFLSLPGGLVADRLTLKRVVQCGQLCNMSLAGIVAGFMLTDRITFEILVAGAVLQGTVNALMMPARQSMVSEIVSRDRLMNAIALNSSGTNVMRLAGPPVGGILLVLMGPGWVYLAMASLYLFGALCMIPVQGHPDAVIAREARRQARAGRPQSLGTMLNDLRLGCQYMVRDRTVFLILGVSFTIVMLSQPYQMMLPGFAKDVLKASPGELGLLMSLIGVGALAGSLVVASMAAKRRGFMLLCSALIMGLTTLAFALSTNFWISGVIALALGIGQALRMSVSNVLIQTYTDSEYLGRVMSVYMMEFSLVALGTFFIGILSNAIGVQAALAIMACGLVVLAGMLLLFAPKMRALD